MAALDMEAAISVRPLSPALGADISGVDLARADDAVHAQIERAWNRYSVLRFRDQDLSDGDLMKFSARFGKLDRVPIRSKDVLMPDDPATGVAPEGRGWVTVISNVKVNGKAIGGLGSYESVWHTDMSYNPEPPMASALYALEVPASGGDTGFASMYLAYEQLSGAMRQRIEGLACIHDASRNSAGELRQGYEEIDDPRQTVGARHPLVRTHPVTGRKALFLGRRRNAYVVGLSLGESEAVLDELWAHAAQPAFCWTQTWKPHDLVIWDNRCVMHRRDAFDGEARRVMHRTQICGDKPY